MRSQYEEGLWITSVRLGLSGQEDRVLPANYGDPWISDSPPTPGVSIRQRPRLVPGGVFLAGCRLGHQENSIGCRSFTQLLAG